MSAESIKLFDLLESIDASLKVLVAAHRATAVASGAVADALDLDGKYGDEVVRFNPRDWNGDDIKGAKMSACPPEALELLAKAYDYFAQKNEKDNKRTDAGKPVWEYDKRSAARARGWAQRKAEGWKHPAGDDTEITW